MSLSDVVSHCNSIGDVWTHSFLRACWQGGLAVGVVWMACFLLRRRLPAGLRCLLWWLVCLKLTFGLAGLSPVEISLAPRSTRSLPLPAPPPLIAAYVAPSQPSPASATTAGASVFGRTPPSLSLIPSAAVAAPVPTVVPVPSPKGLLLALWVVGVLVGLTRLVRQAVAARRLVGAAWPLADITCSVRSEPSGEAAVLLGLEGEIATLARTFGLRHAPRLRLSAQTQSPLLVGLIHPVILLPKAQVPPPVFPAPLGYQSLHEETPSAPVGALTPDEWRMALAHELSHVRRGDLWLGLLPSLTHLLFFFYPLAWLACREFVLAREEACDAEAVQTVPISLEAYGRLLLKFVAPRKGSRSAVMLGAGSPYSQLQRRLLMLEHLSLRPVSPMARRRMRLLACAFMLLGVLSMVPWRVVDAQEAPAPFGQDTRLEQRVLVNVEGMPVEDVLTQLSRTTGVTLLADRETGDDKVICFGPARPLRDFLTDLAALLGDHWTQSKGADGKNMFHLRRDARIRDYESRLADQMNARMIAELDKQVAALKETPEQLKQRPAEDSIRRVLSHNEGRLATQFYGLLSAQQKQELFAEGHTDSVAFTALTPDQQQPLRQWFAGRIEAQKKMAAETNYSVRVGNSTVSSTTSVSRLEDLEQGVVRFDINGESGSADTNILLRVGGMNVLELRQFVNAQRSLLPAHGDPYTGKPVAARAALPSEADVRIALSLQDWRDKLHQLADRAQVPILADYYRAAAPVAAYNQSPADATTPDVAALDTLCRPDAYLWWTCGKTLLLRKREWYLHRQYETPDRWTREMARRLEASKGVPTYADLLRLTELTPRQITGLLLAQNLPASNRGADGLLNLLLILKTKIFNERKVIAGEAKVSADHLSIIDPSEAEAVIVNEPGGLPEMLRRYLASIYSPLPADLTGLKILTFYSYLSKRNDNTPTHKAFMAAMQKQLELHKTGAPDAEETKRADAEATKLMSEDMDERLHSKARDERFVYVNLTAILLQQRDDPSSPQSSVAFSTSGDTTNSDVPVSVKDVHHANNYHVILPRSLAGDRAKRSRIESEVVHSPTR